MKHIKLFEEFTSGYKLTDDPKSGNKFFRNKRRNWLHDIDKETGDIRLRKPYGGKLI